MAHAAQGDRVEEIVAFNADPAHQAIEFDKRLQIVVHAFKKWVLIVEMNFRVLKLAMALDRFRPEFDGVIDVDANLKAKIRIAGE